MLDTNIIELESRLQKFPRIPLICKPTPLHKISNVGSLLGVKNLYCKRDDLTGFALGGNKTRMHEFLLGHWLENEIQDIINKEYAHSNLDRQLAFACSKVGIDYHFVVEADPVKEFKSTGNYFLSQLSHTHIYPVAANESGETVLNEIMTRLSSQGKKFHLLNQEDRIISVLGYVSCALELIIQCLEKDFLPDFVVLSAHRATQSGLVLGLHILNPSIQVIGIRAFAGSDDVVNSQIKTLIAEGSKILQYSSDFNEIVVQNIGRYAGNYRVLDAKTFEAIDLMASKEGIFLDPIYNGKAMKGLIDLLEKKEISNQKKIIFLHTGGIPNIFTYSDDLLKEKNRLFK